jgi:hypothetical protein
MFASVLLLTDCVPAQLCGALNLIGLIQIAHRRVGSETVVCLCNICHKQNT